MLVIWSAGNQDSTRCRYNFLVSGQSAGTLSVVDVKLLAPAHLRDPGGALSIRRPAQQGLPTWCGRYLRRLAGCDPEFQDAPGTSSWPLLNQ